MNNYWDITGEENQLPPLPNEIIIESLQDNNLEVINQNK